MLKGASSKSFPQVHTSRFGIIPKSTPGKWRLIVDLSSPEGRSVNDGVAQDRCSLSYVGVDDAAREILAQGQGALLAKVDIKRAYRNIPVHPDDRWRKILTTPLIKHVRTYVRMFGSNGCGLACSL